MAFVLTRLSLAQLQQRFAQVGDLAHLLDWSRPLKVVAIYLAARAKDRFDQSAGPDGRPWPPLKRPRPKRKGQRAGRDKPLIDTGLLRASMSARHAADHIEEVHGSSLTFGTSVWYASFHQHGTQTIPARPFSGLSPVDETRIQEIAGRFILQEALRLFGRAA
jgi:phage virion morphogenesis protein